MSRVRRDALGGACFSLPAGRRPAAPLVLPVPPRARAPIPYNGFHMRLRLAITVAVLAAVALGQQSQRQDRLVRLPARGMRGAVAGGSTYATEAGMRMYTHGGNAVDAGDQKRVATPAQAIGDGADYLVIGRQITRAADPAAEVDRILMELAE